MEIIKNLYQCSKCGTAHINDVTEEEMRKEYAKDFPNDPEMVEAITVVCDDCYRELGFKGG